MTMFNGYKVPVELLGQAIHQISRTSLGASGNSATELDEIKLLVAAYGSGFEHSILPEVILTRLNALRHAVEDFDLSDWAWQVDDDTWGASKPLVHAAGEAPLRLIADRLCFDADDLQKLSAAFADEDQV